VTRSVYGLSDLVFITALTTPLELPDGGAWTAIRGDVLTSLGLPGAPDAASRA
jgi:hypothetical protein